jgi:hypothetical protein
VKRVITALLLVATLQLVLGAPVVVADCRMNKVSVILPGNGEPDWPDGTYRGNSEAAVCPDSERLSANPAARSVCSDGLAETSPPLSGCRGVLMRARLWMLMVWGTAWTLR